MIRVRFAPSPPGTSTSGPHRALQLALRQEDPGDLRCSGLKTPPERSTEEHTKVILDGLTWLGITWDEGPVFQGTMAAPPANAERLLAEGKAYRCFCTKEELEAQRRGGPGGDAFKYGPPR